MPGGFHRWSRTADSNNTADSTIGWSEGQAPSTVNNSARAMMARTADYRDDTSGVTATGGSADAYTFASYQTLTALVDGYKIAFTCNATNTGASTINVDSMGAKPLRAIPGTALAANTIVSGSIYTAMYDSGGDEWLLHGYFGSVASGATILIASGTVAAPGLAFSADTDSGLYRIGANNVGVGVNGAKVLDVATTGLSITGQIVGSAGSASAPGYVFPSDLDTGMYQISANRIGFACNGSLIYDINTNGAIITGQLETTGLIQVDTTLAVTGATTLTGALTANNSAGVTARNTCKASAIFSVSGTTVSFTTGNHFNVATISRVSEGEFDVAFTNALPTANYAVTVSGKAKSGATGWAGAPGSKLTTGFRLSCTVATVGAADPGSCDFIVFGF